MDRTPYYILEVASTHGGKLEYVYQLLAEFENFKGIGIKFQAFKYDLLAETDYKGYSTYKELFFDESDWKAIISSASQSKEVWLDLFDEYSLKILAQNAEKIRGFKIQSSVLGNVTLFENLGTIDLNGKLCILNISGYEAGEIKGIVSKLQDKIGCEIILQAGFQSHPTEFINSGLVKIEVLKKEFPNCRLSFADHLVNSSGDVLWLPHVASLIGAEFIEKHIRCEVMDTKYDHYSSITHSQFSELFDLSSRYHDLLNAPFINATETQFLNTSLLVPVLKRNKLTGQILSKDDFDYKRTSKKGLDTFRIFDTNLFRVVANDLGKGSAIQADQLKQARIGAVVVCRMKSKRLPKKALARVGQLTSVELCIKNTLQFGNVDRVILATSTHPDDEVLKDYTYSRDVPFFRGSEDDVIARLLGVADAHGLDVIVRVTADSPYRSNEVLQLLLQSHFDKGADYTAAKNAAIGTNTEVINVEALRRVHELFQGTPFSEYLSYYFLNNQQLFNLNRVTLPEKYSNSYRLTLDYDEDLQLFREIEREFDHSRNNFSALELYSFLDNNPQIAGINKHCEVAYAPDSALMSRIIEATTYKGRS